MEIPNDPERTSKKPSNPRILDNPMELQSNNDNNNRNHTFQYKNNPKNTHNSSFTRVGIKFQKKLLGWASEWFQSSDECWQLQLQQQLGVQVLLSFLLASVKIAISTAPYGFCWKVYFLRPLRKTFLIGIKNLLFTKQNKQINRGNNKLKSWISFSYSSNQLKHRKQIL